VAVCNNTVVVVPLPSEWAARIATAARSNIALNRAQCPRFSGYVSVFLVCDCILSIAFIPRVILMRRARLLLTVSSS
jgi:hypothetical protein